MRVLAMLCAGACVVMTGVAVAAAQDASAGVMPPPKVLVIQREFVKTGKTAEHEKSESQFVAAMRAAKWQTHYLAAESLSGRPRVLFMMGYPSFAAWEKDNHDLEKNASLSETMDRLDASDGELLTEFGQSVFVLDPEHSLRAGDAVHSRYFEITQFKVKPGHRAEFLELAKMYKDGLEKVSAGANWALYESFYGEDNGGYYLAISRTKTLAEDDEGMGDDKKLADALGPDKMKKLGEMTASCLDSEQTNLFEFKPKMSYAADEWVQADPFWKGE